MEDNGVIQSTFQTFKILKIHEMEMSSTLNDKRKLIHWQSFESKTFKISNEPHYMYTQSMTMGAKQVFFIPWMKKQQLMTPSSFVRLMILILTAERTLNYSQL